MGKARKYAHVNWQAIRDLIQHGASLRQISATFDIPYYTLAARSYRERWNVMAIRANLPPKTKAEVHRKDSRSIDLQNNAIKNGVTLPLVKLANYYQSADVQTLLKESTRFMSFVHASLKFLSLNDGRSANGQNPTVNLQLLAMPGEVWRAREIQAASVESAKPETDSSSVDASTQGAPNQGTPNQRSEPNAKSAAQ